MVVEMGFFSFQLGDLAFSPLGVEGFGAVVGATDTTVQQPRADKTAAVGPVGDDAEKIRPGGGC